MVKPGSENPKDGTNTLNRPTFCHSCPIWCGPTAKYRWMTQMMRLQNPSWQNKRIQRTTQRQKMVGPSMTRTVGVTEQIDIQQN